MCFLNLSNHPSAAWPPEQRAAAEALAGEIRDAPFPVVDPAADLEMLQRQAIEVLAALPSDASHAMVMGEFVLTCLLIQALQRRGVRCVAATTARDVLAAPDGKKISVFRFVRFRDYPRLF